MHDLVSITAFASVVSSRSFAAAARTLGMTPSAVSKAVARLERRLGVKLLVRTTRSLRVSEAGAAFHARCAQILDDLAAAERSVRVAGEGPRGRLRLGLPLGLGSRAIVPLLADFAARYPEVELDVRLDDRYADLVADGIDAAVRVGGLGDSQLVARKLGATRHVLLASPAYLSARSAPASIAELEQHTLLAFRSAQTGRSLPWQFVEAGRRRSIAPRARHTFTDSHALVAAAASGLGVIQVLDFAAAQPLAQGELIELLARHSAPGPAISLVYPREHADLPKLRAWSEFLGERFRPGPPGRQTTPHASAAPRARSVV